MPRGSVKLTSQVMLEKWLAARAICVHICCWSSEHKHMLNRQLYNKQKNFEYYVYVMSGVHWAGGCP